MRAIYDRLAFAAFKQLLGNLLGLACRFSRSIGLRFSLRSLLYKSLGDFFAAMAAALPAAWLMAISTGVTRVAPQARCDALMQRPATIKLDISWVTRHR